MCGVVDGGIVAGLWGYEAGQSGVGDIFAWYVGNEVPGEFAAEAARRGVPRAQLLDEKAGALPAGGHGLVALDWHGGNRSVLVDHELSGADRGPDAGHPRRRRSTGRCWSRPRSAPG